MIIPPGLITKVGSLLAPVAAKLTSPLVKWGLIGAVILATNLYTWHRTTLECERERTAEAEAQAQVFAEKESKIIANREAIYQELNQTRQLSNDQITNLKKRMVIYERNAKLAKSAVPPDSVGMFNAVSGLFPSVGRVPGSPSPTGKSYEPSETGIEATELLLAHNRARTDCGAELTTLWNDYAALVKAIRSQGVIEKG